MSRGGFTDVNQILESLVPGLYVSTKGGRGDYNFSYYLKGYYHSSLAKRISGMARRAGLEPGVLLTGGVALNPGFAAALEDELRLDIYVAKTPQFNGAIGTAIIAANLNEGER